MLDFHQAKIGSMKKVKFCDVTKGAEPLFACVSKMASNIIDFFSLSSPNVRGGGLNLVIATLHAILIFSEFVHSSRMRQLRIEN